MDVKSWREKKRFSQEQLAEELNKHAKKRFLKEMRKPICQRTISSWENRGVIPRRFWIDVVESITHRQVQLRDFYRRNADMKIKIKIKNAEPQCSA